MEKNLSVKLKALFLAVIMMFALASNAFAAGMWVNDINDTSVKTIHVQAKKGQYLHIINCGEKNLWVYHGIGQSLTPHQELTYRAPKTATYVFKFQTTNGGNGKTTYAWVTGGTSIY